MLSRITAFFGLILALICLHAKVWGLYGLHTLGLPFAWAWRVAAPLMAAFGVAVVLGGLIWGVYTFEHTGTGIVVFKGYDAREASFYLVLLKPNGGDHRVYVDYATARGAQVGQLFTTDGR